MWPWEDSVGGDEGRSRVLMTTTCAPNVAMRDHEVSGAITAPSALVRKGEDVA